MKVIILSAKAMHGKDTFAAMLKEELESKGKRVAITHFAKYIKNILIDFYGAETKDGSYNTIVKDDFVRTKLQKLGTEIIRQEMKMPMFHVKRICEDIDIVKDDFDYIIVSDCRFTNEVDFTKAYFPRNVIDVRIERENFKSPLTEEQLNHPSETDLDDYEFELYAKAGNLEELKWEAEEFAEMLVNFYE